MIGGRESKCATTFPEQTGFDQPSGPLAAPMVVTSEQLSPSSDRVLSDAVLEHGDERAFRALYRRHTPYLYQFVLRVLGGNEYDADDVVQETWIRAAENLATFRWEAPLRSWLVGIAINRCRSLFRRKDRGWLTLEENVAWPVSAKLEEQIDMERALTLMPSGYRTVLLLHDLEGYRHHEIAAMLGTSVGTSKSQLFHARQCLRSLLQSREAEAR